MHVCLCPFVSVHTLNQVPLTSRQFERVENGIERERGERKTAVKEGGGMDVWTEMPSISQGAKALEMASSFRESKAKEREK